MAAKARKRGALDSALQRPIFRRGNAGGGLRGGTPPGAGTEAMQAYLAEYLPILIFLAIAIGLAAIILLASLVVARQSPDREKISAYECGFEPFGDARQRFDVRFYLVAILFIIFDLEVAFLFPWAVTLGEDRRVRLLVDDGLPRRADGRLRLRVAQRSVGMGVSPATALPGAAPAWPPRCRTCSRT